MHKIYQICIWHNETFPKATLEGQRRKFKEEFEEFVAAEDPEHKLAELADMYIVACGIKRFDESLALHLIGRVLEFGADADFTIKELLCAIDKKMEINKARKWSGKDGCYHHRPEEYVTNIPVDINILRDRVAKELNCKLKKDRFDDGYHAKNNIIGAIMFFKGE